MYIIYFTLLFIILLFIIFKLYIKIKYRFWSNLPFFHKYNIFNWIQKNGIIDNNLPEINKFCNYFNIITYNFDQLDNNLYEKICKLLMNDSEKNTNSKLFLSTFKSYFIGCNSDPYISIYYNKEYYKSIDEKNILECSTDLIPSAIITTRPLNISFNKNISKISQISQIKTYYTDYLCIDKKYKNSEILEELFQTHIYFQRYKNKKIKILLLKRREKIPGVVALTTYNIYKFEMKNVSRANLPHASMQLIEIAKNNIRLLTNFIYNQKNKLDCFILPDLANLLNLINNNTYKIYGIVEKDILLCCYFFRVNSIENIENIELFASICDCNNKLFITGFIMLLTKNKISLISIENISHNNIIINNLSFLNIIPKSIRSISYYLYNYIQKPIFPEKIFIIN
jgi:hypothetical protein